MFESYEFEDNRSFDCSYLMEMKFEVLNVEQRSLKRSNLFSNLFKQRSSDAKLSNVKPKTLLTQKLFDNLCSSFYLSLMHLTDNPKLFVIGNLIMDLLAEGRRPRLLLSKPRLIAAIFPTIVSCSSDVQKEVNSPSP